MRISDWSSDGCSSGLQGLDQRLVVGEARRGSGGGLVDDERDARARRHVHFRAHGADLADHPHHPAERGVGLGIDERLAEGRPGREGHELRLALPGLLPELLGRSEEHTSELQSLMRISYAVFCLKKTK